SRSRSSHLSSTQKKLSEEAKEVELTERIPAASKEAVDFLSLIDEIATSHFSEIKEIQPCLFEESLVAISESGETIGTFSISVKWACYSLDGWQEEDCFLVRANSKVAIDGVPCKISLTGYVTKKLEILEQHIQESVRFRNHPVETRTRVVKRHDQLYVTKTIVEKDEKINVSTFSYRCAQLEGLISESANFLLLRVMARRQSLPQNAIFLSFDSDQHVCTSTYEELQASHATYVRRHPELNTLLADFLQLLLLRKPDDVVTFAAEFFAPFSAQQPPCRSFQSSDRPSPFRSHV
ncbi:hypothetical protein Chor_016094, partial [Crotalus horridus]